MSKKLDVTDIQSVSDAATLSVSTSGSDTSVPFNTFAIVCFSKIESTLKDENNNNRIYNGYYIVNRELKPEEKKKVKAYYDACKAFEKSGKNQSAVDTAKAALTSIVCDGTISHRALFSRVLCPSVEHPESVEHGTFVERLSSNVPRTEIIDTALQGGGYFEFKGVIKSFGSTYDKRTIYMAGSPKENPAHTFTTY